MGIPFGHQRQEGRARQDCKRKDGWIYPSSFVSKRQGQGVDAADFGSNACNAHEGFGRSGKGRERPFPSTNQKSRKTFLFSFLDFSFFRMCDSDTRGLDLSVLFRECKTVRARSDLYRSWLMHPARLNVRTFGLLVLVTAQHARLLRAAKASLEGRVERQPPCLGSGGEFLEILQVLDMQQGVA
jgi:hypothetical protein